MALTMIIVYDDDDLITVIILDMTSMMTIESLSPYSI